MPSIIETMRFVSSSKQKCSLILTCDFLFTCNTNWSLTIDTTILFWGWLQENTRVKLQSVLQDLCGEDCKLEIFQEDRSDELIVSGNYVEGEQKIGWVDSISVQKSVWHLSLNLRWSVIRNIQ